MATAAPKNVAPGKSVAKAPAPPEEQFWQRYSPHHEAPLSGIGSFFLHFLFAGFLLLAGYLGWLGLGAKIVPNVDVVRFEQPGGGGDPRGSGDNTGIGAPSKEAAADAEKSNINQKPSEQPKPERPELADIKAINKALPKDFAANDEIQQYIKEGNENVKALAQMNKEIQDKLRQNLNGGGAKGKGGTGKDGGRGSGEGKGDGSGRGEGKLSQREKRQLRWTMIFDTVNEEEYIRILRSLGAIVAIPKDEKGASYWLIRDLVRRPADLLDEDVSKLNRIFWISQARDSVASFCHAMRISPLPSHFVIFLPLEFEDELRRIEGEYRGLAEEEIYETTFSLERRGNRYVPRVKNQLAKSEKQP